MSVLSPSLFRSFLIPGLALVASGCAFFFPPEPVDHCAIPDICGVGEGLEASCLPADEGRSYVCYCYGDNYESLGDAVPCTDIDECAAGPMAACGLSSAICTNTEGSYNCACPSGYEEGIDGATSKACFDVDECAQTGFCDAICTNKVGSADCESTVADESSPYWQYACPINDRRYIENPTHFDMDCRCTTQVGRPSNASHPDYAAFNRCKTVTDPADWKIGQGISVRDWRRSFGADLGATRMNGAWLDEDTRTLYVGAQWQDNSCPNGNPECRYYGAVIAVNVDFDSPQVGNRTLVSGYTLEGDRGDGPTLRAVQSINKGPDGKMYTMSWEAGHPAQIMRINFATGDRELIWKEESYLHNAAASMPASQCHNGSTIGVDGVTAGGRLSLQYTTVGQNMTIDNDGYYYVGAMQNGPAKGPRGVVRISPDGSRCEWVTRFAATENNRYAPRAPANQPAGYGQRDGTGPFGAGPNNFASNPVNLYFREDDAGQGWIYALDGIGSGGTGTRYYRINIDTGDREQLFSSIIGDSHNAWDPEREVLWTFGGFDATRIVALDILGHDGNPPTELGGLHCLSTTSDWYQCMRGPGDMDRMNRGGAVYDPLGHNLIIVHAIWGIVRVEIATGNTYTISR